VTETTTKADPDSERNAIEEKHAARRKATAAKIDARPPRNAPPEDVLGDSSGGDKGDAGTTPGATPSTAANGKAKEATAEPKPHQPPDLSHLPEKYRAPLQSLDPETREWVLNQRREADRYFTKEREKLLDEQRRFDGEKAALKEKADLWDRVLKNPRAAQAAQREFDRPAGESDIADDFEPDTAARIDARIARTFDALFKQREADIRKVATEVARSAIDDDIKTPISTMQRRVSSVTEFGAESGFDKEALNAAIGRANEYAKVSGGKTWDTIEPENAVEWLRPYLPAKAQVETPTTHPRSPSAPGRTAGVAAHDGGSGAVKPPPLPNHMRENRPPKGADETREHLAYVWSQKHPDQPVTADQLKRGGM